MAENNVHIAIKALQRRGGETDSMRQQTEGRLEREGEGWRLTYSQVENGQTTLTTLRLWSGQADLTRSGAVSSRMVFREGRIHTSRYDTPYGALPMSIRTLRLEWDLTEAGGTVFLIYQLNLGGADMGENRLRLTVTKKASDPDAEAKETLV